MADFSLVPGGHGSNYTGMLTRSIVFSGALFVFLAASGMTIASIAIPDWISFDGSTNHGTSIRYSYGLHRRCSNTNLPPSNISYTTASNWHCTQFPRYEDCRGDDRYFCSMWRSVGFLMSFAVVLEGMTLAAFAVLLVGGKQKREQGWGVLTILVALAAFVQAVGMALMAYLYENDERFFSGWYLDKSWTMCTVSWSFEALCAVAITLAAVTLPSEGGYELIPDHG
ncbi:uncharacterized protein Z520_09285 [Fonsecaea multimorphosa CBS 102226]|uniref:Uncharacterized protein n=1 Tax=Fonsecaea multimorphosa CBS 102226 TaxID=1442371 RepID=A0A0D2GZM0_9EURO|nr:uncharacterized protein Z520_09285 [Fonsecaea multimorphosa CBS 102226]KIX94975.1 hypothetical protein Z520_09285 [Fonsecaea multimorphosa CBS 102226]OAL20626.1 hypothetical protein AYO22_08635 [Fonsecaea multimorphosa]